MRILVGLFLLIPFFSKGQSQLVVLSKEKVVARFSIGDDFIYKRRGSDKYTKAFITDLHEFDVVTFNDTVKFSAIERVSLKGQPRKKNVLSKFLITAGLAYFVLDQVNNVIVHGQKPDMEPSVWKPALAMVAAGYAIHFIRKGSQEIRYPARLMTVSPGSHFYLDPQQ
jgi:hypothetical protein